MNTQIYLKFENIEFLNYYNNDNSRVIKVTNKSNSTKSLRMDYFYSSVFMPYYKYHCSLNPNHWVEPSLDILDSCSFIMLYIDDVLIGKINLLSNKNLKKIKDKIVCVGLNKTGTTSLTQEIENLGFTALGGSNGLNNGELSNYCFTNQSVGTSIDLIEKTNIDFFQDIPFSCPTISEKIISIFPQCKYILTTRNNAEEWVQSVKRFFKPFFIGNNFNFQGSLDINVINTIYDRGEVREPTFLLNMFETWGLDLYSGNIDDKLKQVYINHNLSVKNTLNSNNCDWIEINVSKKGELKKLTNWLNIENKKPNFTWLNKSK